MDARGIDPRDITRETDQRTYRVYFSDRQPDDPEYDVGHTDEWEISDADLAQVLAWIAENARGRAYSLYAYTEREQQHVLHHLMSKDRYGRSTSVKVSP